jgi:hypothetical protein
LGAVLAPPSRFPDDRPERGEEPVFVERHRPPKFRPQASRQCGNQVGLSRQAASLDLRQAMQPSVSAGLRWSRSPQHEVSNLG